MERKNMILPRGPRDERADVSRLLISLPATLRAQIKQEADRLGVSESEAARQLLGLGIRARALSLTVSE